jgi:hypothetical protein
MTCELTPLVLTHWSKTDFIGKTDGQTMALEAFRRRWQSLAPE